MNKFPNKANAFIKYVRKADYLDLRCKDTKKNAYAQVLCDFFV